MTEALRKLVHSAIRDRAILHTNDQRLVAPNGSSNSWLIDLRLLSMDATLLDAMAELFWQICGDKMPFQIGGMETAATPLVAAILMQSVARGTPINGFIIRKERKTYGAGNLIEGSLTDDPIIIVDDVLNSGASLEKVRAALEHESKTIAFAFVYIDYHHAKSEAWRSRHLIPVVSAFSLTDFGLSIKKQVTATLPPLFKNVWRFVSPDPNFFDRVPKSFPATCDNRIYFGSDCGMFWCLDAGSGKVIWKFQVNTSGHKNIWSAPALWQGRVFFGAYDGNVYSLNATTGAEAWRFTEADWVGSSPALAPELGLLFIGLEFAVDGRRGSIVALNIHTGEKVWEHSTKRYTHASPAYWAERQVVACGSNDNEMFLFDAPSGKLRWRFETKGDRGKGSIRHAPAFDAKRGQVITGCANGCIYIIDVENGQEVWSVQTDNTIYTVPLVVDDIAYVGSTDKFMYVLNLAERKVQRKIHAGSKVFGPARFLEGKVYFGACNGLIYEIDPLTVEVTGTHQLPDAITNALTYNVEAKCFYALTYVNELYALVRHQT